MTEIFEDIFPDFKKRVSCLYELMLLQKTGVPGAVKVLKEFSDACTESEKEFLDFYLKLQMEKLKNENNLD